MKELFQNIVEDDKRAASILSSLRSMMKLEKRDKERINLNSIVEEIINVYQGETIRKNIGIELNQPELPVFVQADKTQIQQVILNFILNAIQSVEESDAKIRRIVITTNLESEYVKLSVRDFGNGIDGKIYNRLFKSFVTTKKEGTGIGLALSRSIIDDHGGKIWAENMPDGGAVFAFSLKTIS